jgi:quinoprotein dehydrogenase-associated probable ABC transporter substrate-binding protein
MVRFNPGACRRSNSPHRTGTSAALLAGAGLACVLIAAHAQDVAKPAGQSPAVLRVCADPGNMPLSNDHAEGYENKIAQALARDLGRTVEFTFFPQRMGFVRNTLRQRDEATQQFKCDVIIGVPKGFELTATTRPYMRSTYALLFESREEFARLQSPEDLLAMPPERLRALRIGVFGRSPGADWLLRNELLDHAVFYAPQSGDPAESPALTVERDLAAGKIDMAIVWGPIAGFLAGRHAQNPAWRALPFKPDSTIKFDFEISMGVRFGEKEWKDTLDKWISAHERDVQAILSSYRVPLLDANGVLIAPSASGPNTAHTP